MMLPAEPFLWSSLGCVLCQRLPLGGEELTPSDNFLFRTLALDTHLRLFRLPGASRPAFLLVAGKGILHEQTYL